MDSKNTYLKNIIREELININEQLTVTPIKPKVTPKPVTPKPVTPKPPAVKSPFKDQADANKFIKWYLTNFKIDAQKANITKNSKFTDAKLIAAYNKNKTKYSTYKKQMAPVQANKGQGGKIPVVGMTGNEIVDFFASNWKFILLILGGLYARRLYKRKFQGATGAMTTDQAMTIATDPGKFKKIINKLTNAEGRALKKELQKLNPDRVLTDEEVNTLKKALGNPRFTTELLIQARRTMLLSFKEACRTGKFPRNLTAEKVINTLTADERAKYANTIREMYRKAQVKAKRIAKVKRTYKKVRSKLPYGD